MDLASAIAVAAQAVGIAKDLREIDKGFDVAELKARMADLYNNLADVRMALVDAQIDMREKDSEIEQLKSAFQLQRSLVERCGYKYEAFDSGEPKGDAFCPRCEQNHGRFYRLVPRENAARGSMDCPECKAHFTQVPRFGWNKP